MATLLLPLVPIHGEGTRFQSTSPKIWLVMDLCDMDLYGVRRPFFGNIEERQAIENCN